MCEAGSHLTILFILLFAREKYFLVVMADAREMGHECKCDFVYVYLSMFDCWRVFGTTGNLTTSKKIGFL